MRSLHLIIFLAVLVHITATSRNVMPGMRANTDGIKSRASVLATASGRKQRRVLKGAVGRRRMRKLSSSSSKNGEIDETIGGATTANGTNSTEPEEGETAADPEALANLKAKILFYQERGSMSDAELAELDTEFNEVMGMTIEDFLVEIAATEDLLTGDDKALVEFLRTEYELDALKAKVLSYLAFGFISDPDYEALDKQFDDVMGLTIAEFLTKIEPDLNQLTTSDKQIVYFLRSEYEKRKPTSSPTTLIPPTSKPTSFPTSSTDPTYTPSKTPTMAPTRGPTYGPTAEPTSEPTPVPSNGPTTGPTFLPSSGPAPLPTNSMYPHLDYVGDWVMDYYELGECQGDCDYDSDCGLGLVCHYRHFEGDNSISVTSVPGCRGDPLEEDFCVKPATDNTVVIVADKEDDLGMEHYPLGMCQGDCWGDDDCEGGLKCFYVANWGHLPPGCIGNAEDKYSYCYVG